MAPKKLSESLREAQERREAQKMLMESGRASQELALRTWLRSAGASTQDSQESQELHEGEKESLADTIPATDKEVATARGRAWSASHEVAHGRQYDTVELSQLRQDYERDVFYDKWAEELAVEAWAVQPERPAPLRTHLDLQKDTFYDRWADELAGQAWAEELAVAARAVQPERLAPLCSHLDFQKDTFYGKWADELAGQWWAEELAVAARAVQPERLAPLRTPLDFKMDTFYDKWAEELAGQALLKKRKHAHGSPLSELPLVHPRSNDYVQQSPPNAKVTSKAGDAVRAGLLALSQSSVHAEHHFRRVLRPRPDGSAPDFEDVLMMLLRAGLYDDKAQLSPIFAKGLKVGLCLKPRCGGAISVYMKSCKVMM
ncbi:unnamed protein product, partial [Polarella glacialis]